MTTPRTPGLVSLTATLTITLALGACASASHAGQGVGPRVEGRAPELRFDNDSPEFVQVYVIDDRRQWLLGKVAPGAIAMLRVPQSSLRGAAGPIRLAVIPGARLTLEAARDPGATFTLPLSASSMMGNQWKFAQGQLTPKWIPGAPLR